MRKVLQTTDKRTARRRFARLKESADTLGIREWVDQMEANLPIPDEHKNFQRGSSSPFKVVNEVFAAGETKAGIQTLAFNLPNDERVREAKGSKKVMLKNVMHAKFEKILMPIVKEVIAQKDAARVSFDGYFNQILLHEVSHATPIPYPHTHIGSRVDQFLRRHTANRSRGSRH